jgi:hypothetical protein
MRRSRHRSRRHDDLKFRPLFQTFHGAGVAGLFSGQKLDSQTFATFGATCIDHSAATACFHANQEAMGTGAASFRRLVSAFHDISKKLGPEEIRETNDYLKFLPLSLTFIHTLYSFAFFKAATFSLPCG